MIHKYQTCLPLVWAALHPNQQPIPAVPTLVPERVVRPFNYIPALQMHFYGLPLKENYKKRMAETFSALAQGGGHVNLDLGTIPHTNFNNFIKCTLCQGAGRRSATK